MKIYSKYNLNKKIFDKIVKSADYNNGAKEAVAYLKKKGIKTAIISGGFKSHVNKVAQDLKITHFTSSCELFWKNNKLDSYNVLPFDELGKAKIIDLIRKQYGFKKKECIFVGDGRNDIYAAKLVKSIAFNADKELQKKSSYIINQEKGKEDLRVILKFIS